MQSGQVGAKYIAKQRVKSKEVILINHVRSDIRSTRVNSNVRKRKRCE